MKNIIAVVFDWAGTIIDFGCIAPTFVFVKVFENRGIHISLNDARIPMGLAKKDHVSEILHMPHVIKQWIELTGHSPSLADVDALYLELEPNLAKVVAQYSAPISGAIDLIDLLKSNGIKVGSTTGYVSSMMDTLIPLAHKNSLHLDSIVSSDMVSAGRPAPWMIYRNMENMRVFHTWKMVKIGDTLADIAEGLNAGMWTVGLTKSGNEFGVTQDELDIMPEKEKNTRNMQARKKMLDAGAHFVADGVWDCQFILEEISQNIGKGIKPY